MIKKIISFSDTINKADQIPIREVLSRKLKIKEVYQVAKPEFEDIVYIAKLRYEINIFKARKKWYLITGKKNRVDYHNIFKYIEPEEIEMDIHNHPANEPKKERKTKKLLKKVWNYLNDITEEPPYYIIFPSYVDVSGISYYKRKNAFIITKYGVVKYNAVDDGALDYLFAYKLLAKRYVYQFYCNIRKWKKDTYNQMFKSKTWEDLYTFQELVPVINREKHIDEVIE
ncbi:hypothetical protein ACFL56_01290 [Candidatus Margulisiibacteriota bacterium]